MTGVQFFLREVNETCTDLATFTVTLCTILKASIGHWFEAKRAVSSAKVAIVTSGFCGKKDVNSV